MTVTPVAPIRMDLQLRRGSELRIRLEVKTASGDAQPLTVAAVFPTFTATARVGEGKDATVTLTLTQTVVSDAGGIIDFSLTPTQTLTFIQGFENWYSVYVSHVNWTAGIDRLELHGRLDIIG